MIARFSPQARSLQNNSSSALKTEDGRRLYLTFANGMVSRVVQLLDSNVELSKVHSHHHPQTAWKLYFFVLFCQKKKKIPNFGLIYDAQNFIQGFVVFHRTLRNKFLATSGGYFRNSKVLFWTQIQFWILWLKICRLINLFLAFLPD